MRVQGLELPPFAHVQSAPRPNGGRVVLRRVEEIVHDDGTVETIEVYYKSQAAIDAYRARAAAGQRGVWRHVAVCGCVALWRWLCGCGVMWLCVVVWLWLCGCGCGRGSGCGCVVVAARLRLCVRMGCGARALWMTRMSVCVSAPYVLPVGSAAHAAKRKANREALLKRQAKQEAKHQKYAVRPSTRLFACHTSLSHAHILPAWVLRHTCGDTQAIEAKGTQPRYDTGKPVRRCSVCNRYAHQKRECSWNNAVQRDGTTLTFRRGAGNYRVPGGKKGKVR